MTNEQIIEAARRLRIRATCAPVDSDVWRCWADRVQEAQMRQDIIDRSGPSPRGDLADSTFADLHPDALTRIVRECAEFQRDNTELLQRAYDLGEAQMIYDEERAGNDFWYTRNGHGTGFWDRSLGEVGDKLAAISRYRSVDLYKGDDGLVHVS